jgi:hypothetical protein
MSKKVTFDAVIEQHGNMNAGYVVFPYNVLELYGVKGQVKHEAPLHHHAGYAAAHRTGGRAAPDHPAGHHTEHDA